MSRRTQTTEPHSNPFAMLTNPRHQQFAEFVASGLSPLEAYKSAGYPVKSDKVAATCAKRLLKDAGIAAKIAALSTAVQQRAINKTSLTRTWVIDELMDNVRLAKTPKNKNHRPDLAAANSALIALGKEVGMFREQNDHFVWDGRIESLTLAQQRQLAMSLEQIAYRDDPEGLARWRERSQRVLGLDAGNSAKDAAGPIVEVKADVDEPKREEVGGPRDPGNAGSGPPSDSVDD